MASLLRECGGPVGNRVGHGIGITGVLRYGGTGRYPQREREILDQRSRVNARTLRDEDRLPLEEGY